MVREWLHWIAAGGRPSTRRRRLSEETEKTSSAGCMCAVFQLFDLQHHPFNYQPDTGSPFLQEEANTSKGVEAPRNSLELLEPAAMKEEDNSNFPVIKVGINHIKTRVASKSRTEDNTVSSDCSPGTAKTPNLVARLMGLDLLPECNNSPLFSCPNTKPGSKISHIFNQNKTKTCFSDDDIAVGARSSSARRSDYEYHSHRLSLQINKENNGEFANISGKMRGRSAIRFRKDENTRLPAGHFVKQVANQVTEKIGRKVGLTDITNNTNYREEKEETLRRDQNLVTHQQPTKRNNTNISPKIKSLDTKKKIVASSGTKSPRNSISSLDGNDYDHHHHQSGVIPKDGKRVGGGNANIFSGTKKLQSAPQNCDYYSVKNNKLEPPVGSSAKDKAKNSTDKKKTKKLAQLMMSSSEIQNISGPTILSVKKGPSPPATKLPQKQINSALEDETISFRETVSDALSSKRDTQLSRKSSRSYKHLSLQPDRISTVLPDRNNGCATPATTSAAAEYKDYVQKILKRAGIDDKGKWHTVSHPLDPSIFYYLELFSGSGGGGILNRRCNRELIFQLVDELLAEILKPYLDFKPWVDTNFPVNGIDQFGLCDELCKKIGDFPTADCQVLEDIDSLIEKDLCKLSLDGYFVDEGERLVCEIEGEIMNWLLCETVAVVGGGGRASEKEKKTESRHGSRAGEGNHVMRWNHAIM
ncbi:hypothetical protein OROMI_007364 [Orobanche minor]